MNFRTFMLTYWVCADTVAHMLNERRSLSDPATDVVGVCLRESEKQAWYNGDHYADKMHHVYSDIWYKWYETVR
jgi:hypothetical protein